MILLGLILERLGVEIIHFNRFDLVGVGRRRIDAFAVDKLPHPGTGFLKLRWRPDILSREVMLEPGVKIFAGAAPPGRVFGERLGQR